ncbi:MAG: SBBP repeat-containing protein [Saprospiraceae bacterium]
MLTKFGNNGDIIWSTYYGGELDDLGQGITLDPDNNIVITGFTFSDTDIATAGAEQPMNNGAGDGFVAKFNNDGQLLWATYTGGNELDFCNDIATDMAGNVYAIGWSSSSTVMGAMGTHQPL